MVQLLNIYRNLKKTKHEKQSNESSCLESPKETKTNQEFISCFDKRIYIGYHSNVKAKL